MNESETLNSVVAQAIFTAQERGRNMSTAAEEAARAFAAGLAAYTAASDDKNAAYLREAATRRATPASGAGETQ